MVCVLFQEKGALWNVQRYFVGNDQIHDEHVTIEGDDAHHILKVMRMKPGERLIVCNENAQAFSCFVEEGTGQRVRCRIDHQVEEERELPIHVTIVQGLPKGDKLELIVQKATELGVTAFIPFESERAIVKWEQPLKVQKKLDRLRKIAKEAAEQSHRSMVPLIESPISLIELLAKKDDYTHKIVAFEEEAKRGERRGFANLLQSIKQGESLLVVIGPEGGLSEQEVDAFKESGFESVGLGPRILRTETAPLYVLSAVSYHFELSMR